MVHVEKMNKKNWKEILVNKKFEISMMVLFAIFSFIIMYFHESWRDEAQAWLISRDISWLNIIKQVKYEGHPWLWFYLLAFFSKIGLPYFTIKIVSWIATNIFVWILLNRAPFKKITKVLLIFSTPVLYLYPAIARDYCLIPLAIGLIAVYYQKKTEKPIQYILSIMLLANTHLIVWGLVGALLLEFYLEQLIKQKREFFSNKKMWISLIIAIVLLLSIIIPLCGGLSKSITVENRVKTQDSNTLLLECNRMKTTFLRSIQFLYGDSKDIANIVIVLLVFLVVYEIYYYKKNSLLIVLAIMFQVYLYAVIGIVASGHRAATIMLIIILFEWRQYLEDNKTVDKDIKEMKNVIILILLILNIGYGFTEIPREIKTKYSDSYETAQFINNELKDGTFIAIDLFRGSAIIPYVKDAKFWNPKSQDYYTYIMFDEQCRIINNIDELKKTLKESFNSTKDLYIIDNDRSISILDEYINNNELTCVYCTKETDIIVDEYYTIYKVEDSFLE